MLYNIRGPEVLVLLVIVLIIFGAGRISKLATELGQGVRHFREGLAGAKTGSDKK